MGKETWCENPQPSPPRGNTREFQIHQLWLQHRFCTVHTINIFVPALLLQKSKCTTQVHTLPRKWSGHGLNAKDGSPCNSWEFPRLHRWSYHKASLGTERCFGAGSRKTKEKCSSVNARYAMLVVLSSGEDASPWAIISADVSTRAPEDAVNDLTTQGRAPVLPGVAVVLEILQNIERVH